MRATVCIVDDDQDMRDVLARVVRSVGLEPELHQSAAAFLARSEPPAIGCLLLDVQVGAASGLELLEQMPDKQRKFPVFLISGAHDAGTVARAGRLRAIVVDKPFDARTLARGILAAVREAGDPPAS